MIEIRAIVASMEEIKKRIRVFSAENKGEYAFTDYICAKGKVREFTKDNRGPVGIYHISKNSRKQYDSLEDAFAELGRPSFSFSRTGTEFQLGTARIFIELVEGQSMIEIEAENEVQANALAQKLGAFNILSDSLPEHIRKHKSNHS